MPYGDVDGEDSQMMMRYIAMTWLSVGTALMTFKPGPNSSSVFFSKWLHARDSGPATYFALAFVPVFQIAIPLVL
jgi:hypothetical protein